MKHLKLLNKLLLQWFFIRLVRRDKDRVVLDYSLEVTEDGLLSMLKTKEVSASKRHQVWYELEGWVMPCTGFGKHDQNETSLTQKRWHIRLTAIKEYCHPIKNWKEWEEYLEKMRSDYYGNPTPPCKYE